MRQLKITKQITQRTDESISRYFQEISKYSMITAEEEVELSVRIRDGDADALDFFYVYLYAELLIYEDPFGFDDLLVDDFIEEESDSTDTSFLGPYSGDLEVTATLQYGTEYQLFALAESEVFAAAVPEPATLLLFGSGLVGLAGFRRRMVK